MTPHYSIADEPRPTPLQKLAVKPFWPLLAVMFGGVWLSWPWFLLNAHAVGSPSRAFEWRLVGFGLALLGLAWVALIGLSEFLGPNKPSPAYLMIPLELIKLGTTYMLFLAQRGSFDLYLHYGGLTRNGFPVLLAGFVLGRLIFPRYLGDGEMDFYLRVIFF